jgi:hypothetical protein
MKNDYYKVESLTLGLPPSLPEASAALMFQAEVDGPAIITIMRDGRILWRGREVETDDDFRATMLDLAVRFGYSP